MPFPPPLTQAQLIEPGDIVPGDLPSDLLRYPQKIACNILARPWPATLPMGIIVGPHIVVGTHNVRILEADRVIDKARIDIGLEVGAGGHFRRDRGVLMAHAVLVVGQPEEMWYPADIEFSQHDLQARKTIEDAVIDELGKRALGRVMQTGVAVARIVTVILKTMARK